jgi:hypothetical protein
MEGMKKFDIEIRHYLHDSEEGADGVHVSTFTQSIVARDSEIARELAERIARHTSDGQGHDIHMAPYHYYTAKAAVRDLSVSQPLDFTLFTLEPGATCFYTFSGNYGQLLRALQICNKEGLYTVGAVGGMGCYGTASGEARAYNKRVEIGQLREKILFECAGLSLTFTQSSS